MVAASAVLLNNQTSYAGIAYLDFAVAEPYSVVRGVQALQKLGDQRTVADNSLL